MNWRLCVTLTALLVTLRPQAFASDDKELQQLEAQLQSADTQADMNLASKRLAEYWDRKVASIEKQITARLTPKERRTFEKSRKRWQSYRSREVEFRANFFDGGTVQPLIANIAYTELTQHRVNELESLFNTALNVRGEQANRTTHDRGSNR